MTAVLAGKRAVVTGGTRGIGRAIAQALTAAGAAVSVCARGAAGVAEARGRFAHAAICDLAEGDAVRHYIGEAAAALGGIEILVNNASGFGASDDEAGWAASLAVDVMASVRASHAAVSHIAAAGGGAILHISSISGLRPSPRTPPYGAAKAALVHYTQSQAVSLAKQGIRVNCIAPGSIEFPGGSWERRRLAGDPLYARVLAGIPFGRLGTPEEVAEVALFLVSPAARWVTGQTIAVDGGQMLT
ncbi:SDR family NAD(P)-dependent oxidoreductase [Elioraea sp.]|uniref:SDR family NAD(P)-dependent oxidoreductase n=1 Tax=Elioraea sp. TaxID=2185103 RepID=UPI0021DC28A5|nr:SDR family oxidoreductase [Elioraea sp.]GIX08916.1 MAG: 3-oxoacyl-ACP reductase [Elioraea sp.]